jgi:hypothetical protein
MYCLLHSNVESALLLVLSFVAHATRIDVVGFASTRSIKNANLGWLYEVQGFEYVAYTLPS